MDRRPDIAAAVGRMASPDGVRREIQHLPAYLRTGESVQRLAAGVYGVGTGLLAVTDRRVLVLREGRAGQASEGFPFEELRGLDWAAATPEHATVTIRDTIRTTEFTQVAPTDAAELVGFVRALLRPPAPPPVAPLADLPAPPPVAPLADLPGSPPVAPLSAPPVVATAPAQLAPAVAPLGAPPRGTAAGGSIGPKFAAPPAAVAPGAGEFGSAGGAAVAYGSGPPPGGVESTAGVRVERWPLGEVPVSQLVGTPSDSNAVAPAPAPAAPAAPTTPDAPNVPVVPKAPAVPEAAAAASAPAPVNAPDAAAPAVVKEPSRDPAAAAATPASRKPRFWQRSRARAADKTPPAEA